MASTQDLYTRTLALATVAGMRSMSAPALLSRYAGRHKSDFRNTPFEWLASGRAALVLAVMAGGELIADKLPFTPNRTNIKPLIGRMGSGGLVGAALFAAEDQPAFVGGLLGAATAALSTFAAYELRHQAGKKLPLPDPLLGLLEDGAVVGIGKLVI